MTNETPIFILLTKREREGRIPTLINIDDIARIDQYGDGTGIVQTKDSERFHVVEQFARIQLALSGLSIEVRDLS